MQPGDRVIGLPPASPPTCATALESRHHMNHSKQKSAALHLLGGSFRRAPATRASFIEIGNGSEITSYGLGTADKSYAAASVSVVSVIRG